LFWNIQLRSERIQLLKHRLLLIELITKDNTDINYTKFREKHSPPKQSVIGIIFQEEKFFAEVIPTIEMKVLKFLLKKELPLPQALQKYNALIIKGSLYKLKGKGEGSISALKGFWGYLKRKLTAKGGYSKKKGCLSI